MSRPRGKYCKRGHDLDVTRMIEPGTGYAYCGECKRENWRNRERRKKIEAKEAVTPHKMWKGLKDIQNGV